jgi:hypothetical protein
VQKTWILIVTCVVVPPLWGLAVEWVFRRLRGDRGSRYLGNGRPAERRDA